MQILVIGMLDERQEALNLLKETIARRGHTPIIADVSIGTGAGVPALKADIPAEDIARAGGSDIQTIRDMLATERDKAIQLMAQGLTNKALELFRLGQLDGVLAVAGMTGTFLSLTCMVALPFGLPKLLISSVTAMPAYANRFAEYFGVRDITVMHTITDTVGMNPLVRTLMLNGAGAICGMVETFEPTVSLDKPLIAMTEFGFCDKGAGYVRNALGDDYSVVSFHAQGVGDRAVEDLVGQGVFDGFIDLVPSNYGEYLLGGNRAAPPDRLEAACRRGIPYILSPCGFDMISCGPIERKDKNDPLWTARNLADRQLFVQDAIRVQARTSPDEVAMIAQAVAEKLNRHPRKDLVKFIMPMRGFSSLSVSGGKLYAPEVDQVFVDSLKQHLSPEIEVIEVDTDINTQEFGNTAAAALEKCLTSRELAGHAR